MYLPNDHQKIFWSYFNGNTVPVYTENDCFENTFLIHFLWLIFDK